MEPLRRALGGDADVLVPLAAGAPLPKLGLYEPLDPGEDDHDDPTAVMIATSGSTGTPKGVLLSASALRASAEATHARLGGPGRWLVATPVHYVGGLQVLVRAILAGTEPGFVDMLAGFRAPAFAESARGVLAGSGPHYTAMVPTQLARLLDAGGEALAALREFNAVIIGAAATGEEMRRRAVEAGVLAVPAYGMSETASGCVYHGQPLRDVRVTVETGEIEIAGPVLARGYRRDRKGTAAAFAGGRFHTGDLGRIDDDGALEVLGRMDDVVNTGGVKVAPAAVERVLAGMPGVESVCVFGADDPEWGQAVVAAVVPRGTPPALPDIAATVRERLGRASAPKHLMVVDTIPTRGPGKPDRSALRRLFRES
jgi:O-succinylbenzoic acid--CoA ligase